MDTVPRSNFTSRNLGTGRPTIQCTACGEYSHWRKDCPYDNFCTTCDNHDHATHMCRATCQSSAICIHCGNTSHRSGNCPRNSQDNREQLHATPDTLRQQDQQANTENSGSAHGNAAMAGPGTSRHSSQSHPHADAKISRNSDHTMEIIIILVLDIPGTNKMMDITGISRGMTSNMPDLMRDIISGVHLLHTHPPHH